MRFVETIPGNRGRRESRMMEGVNSSIIICKDFCECHKVSPQQCQNVKKWKQNKTKNDGGTACLSIITLKINVLN
jgi:hypothetical protein